MTDSEKSMNDETSGRCDSDILVSVVVPAFNRPSLLHRAIMSVIDQTHRNLEILVVDDGSTEDVRSLLKDFSDDRINYLRHEINKGVSAARNTGTRHSHGEYIAFLDSDDEWLPDKIKSQLEDLRKKTPSYHASYCGREEYDDEKMKVIERSEFVRDGSLLSELLFRNCVGTASSVLMQKECLNRLGGFDEKMHADEDWELWINFSRYYSFAFLDVPLVRYHIHGKGRISDAMNLHTYLPYIYEKHRDLFLKNRKANSHILSEIGYWKMEQDDPSGARRCLLKSIMANPFQRKSYIRLMMSLRDRATKK